MSDAKNKADKIMAYLESNSHPGHGFHRIFGSMKRKESNAIRDGIANLIDGVEPPPVELKPLPVVKPTSVAATGSGGKSTGATPGKSSGGKTAQA